MAAIDQLSLRQICYDIANLISGGIQSDDSPFSLRQIQFWVLNTRAELLSQWITKGHNLSINFMQPLQCVDIAQVDLSTCCGIKTECTAFRTVQRLPKPLSGQYSDLITRVSGVNFIGPTFHIVAHPRVQWELDNKFTFNIPRSFLYDGYLYTVGTNLFGLKKINIEGVWEDPTDVGRFKNCSGDPCFTEDSVFPMSRKMVEMMKRMITGTDLSLFLRTPRDDENDARGVQQDTRVRQAGNKETE